MKNEPTKKTPTKTEIEKASTLIEKEIKKNGPEAIRNIPPVSFSFKGGSDDLLQRSVEVMPVVNPLFDAVMIVLGFDRLGSRSYTIGAGDTLSKKIILSALAATPPSAAFARLGAERASKTGVSDPRMVNNSFDIFSEISRSPAGAKLTEKEVWTALGTSHRKNGSVYRQDRERNERYLEHGLVSFSCNKSSITVTIATTWENYHYDGGGSGIYPWPGSENFHLLPIGAKKDPVFLSPLYALATFDTIKNWGFSVITNTAFNKAIKEARGSIIIESVSGSPGRASVAATEDSLKGVVSDIDDIGFKRLGETSLFVADMEASDATSFHSNVSGKKANVVIDPRVMDVVSMTNSAPSGTRDGLRPYQDEAVSLHLSTTFGYVNACAPGLGKTVMSLQAMRERSGDGYRALVVCPASIRSQWIAETNKFFPEARVETFKNGDLKKGLNPFLTKDKTPAVVVLSYDVMRAGADVLSGYVWNDFILDEAAILKNQSSHRSRALWQLRETAEVAVALTGTPINKSLDDLGNIVSWVRDDKEAFYGQRLSQRFSMATDAGVESLWQALGPTVFRRDRSEISDQLPKIDTEVISIDPEPEELALANGARDELRKIYATLEEKLSVAESIKPDDPALKEARADMRTIRGAVLGGTTLARMAASDPGSLENASSSAAGIALLKSAGLLEPALKKGGTKRKLVTSLVEDLVSRDDRVLIFTDFSSVAENLAGDLVKKGVKVGTFTGKNSGKKRDQEVKDFQDGKTDCLILTGAGREGLNLQRANVLIHYDLPWVPSQVVQRVGRASRFGSTNSQLSVVVPIVKGTIEERVAAILIPRAVEALRALDSSRGVKGGESEIGLAISGLDGAVPADVKEDNTLFDMAAALVK